MSTYMTSIVYNTRAVCVIYSTDTFRVNGLYVIVDRAMMY